VLAWATNVKRLLVTVILFAAAAAANAQHAVILVRHAEKATDSNEAAVPLSEAGRARAARLAHMLAGAGITAIYVTETERARQTAEPLAKSLKLEVRPYASRDAAGKLDPRILIDRLRKDDAAGTVFVVGHQNTVPDLIAALGYPEKIEIGDRDFDDFFLVVPKAGAPPTVVRLKY
jgi:phosphohistidine phosphatase SixA